MSRTWIVNAALPVHYQVRVVDGVFNPTNRALLEAGATQRTGTIRRLVVLDAEVERLYGVQLRHYLQHHGVKYQIISLPISETEKTMDSVFAVVKGINEFGISRRHEPIIAIGGGVLMDIVGLAASLYRRSTPYVRVPTTLIGLVDAGVGVKTGVNHSAHKNRLGTYFPARDTLLDRGFLKTVDTRHIVNGLAEILKIALIKDRTLFELLERHGTTLITERLQGRTPESNRAATQVIERAITGMLEELEMNLWEHKLERVVDYGHSFSPTIEMLALPELLHGEAVNIDMALTTLISAQRGMITPEERDRIFTLMRKLELPVYHRTCEPAVLVDALADTVRHRDGLQRLPLAIGIGSACFVNDVTPDEMTAAATALREMDASSGSAPMWEAAHA
ncbi:sedoheptulose 7-phosphate cyclase [Archangium lansingense]|uniref:Sedoheptulose 7-phosphate cyclase n=1 Tax=Archangium lansingense TaxID=2995310 RepID=A0ABT4AAT0_9BACT|nr:sedoheptulose 7-phosphate cyclase [Archangium lansinium]MCY1078783.1 sedoheptulose 7-phosphate cyclase [Archangium lansinium]